MNDRILSYSIFLNGATDRHPKAHKSTWDGLVDLLGRNWIPHAVANGDDPKKGLAGLSGATFRDRATRALLNVERLDLVIFDMDNARSVETREYYLDRNGRPSNRPRFLKQCIPDPIRPESAVEALLSTQTAGFVYTTWSHTEGWPRFRIIVPLAQPVPAEQWKAATEVALDRLKLRPFLAGLDLPVLRDSARMHFLPGSRTPETIKRWVVTGKALWIPVEDLCKVEVPAIPLMAWQERICQERKATCATWFHDYRSNGQPVDFRRLDLVKLLRAMGIKVGHPQAYGAGTKWRTHCPWASEHTHGLDDDSAVVIHIAGHWPVWICAHSHHAHLGLRDLLETFGGVL